MVSLNLGLSVLILASFLIVYAVFTKFFWRPILHTIRDREEMIQTEIESTKKALKDAEKIRDMQEDVLFTARIEADRIMVEARRSAERIKADIIETAKLAKEGPRDFAALKELARLSERTGRVKAAVRLYREALSLQPNDPVSSKSSTSNAIGACSAP